MWHERMRGIAAVLGLGAIVCTAPVAVAVDVSALWDKHCGACHGKDGTGDTKAGKVLKVQDLTDPERRATLTPERIHEVTANGIVDQATGKSRMKAYKDTLSPEELDALTNHVLGFVEPEE